MSEIALKPVEFGGIKMEIPEIWEAVTQAYTEPDGRVCSMIDISAVDGDPRSIVISYGPMPEGSDTFMEASDILGSVGFGFEGPTEDNRACNFICAEISSEGRSQLFTILTTARSYEEIDDLLDLVEQKISFE